ncbi:MAG: FAD-dependent oxidoreductase [Flavobacterium sp.]|uniref:flavin monoamine oxidase family protein n=1 Tax=Flavobacterium sp. TaxID=239 RepID=UPI00122057C5|nr:NAD(P)/FAD-dependent oxidoreductase [Flavobacterium sp.]RZJ65865.1 MAG: FAD-dependent oxidoreductase [Flavobacterium sp.]
MRVIVVGAGAAGLMSANILSKKGCDVVLLEAGDRIGGRIHTLTPPGFSNHVEAAAEFIHGKLPLTLQLMKKAKLEVVPATGKMYRSKNDKIDSNFGNSKAWSEFYEALFDLKRDCSLQELLDLRFSAKKYATLRNEAIDMAQGLDLGEPGKLSLFNVREEWTSQEMQYRPVSGYAPLLEFISNDSDLGKRQLHFNEKVSRIEWQRGFVKAITATDVFIADAIVVTVPISVYHNNEMEFSPEIPQLKLFDDIGFGEVIKIALEFDTMFWEEKYADLGFLFTEAGFTFWTQLSQHKPLLIAWIGNADASSYDSIADEEMIERSVSELEKTFGNIARDSFRVGKVFRFTKKSPTKGGYSWFTTKSRSAVAKLNRGIDSTIYFAGEALEPKGDNATVEAALQSGRHVANKILRSSKHT